MTLPENLPRKAGFNSESLESAAQPMGQGRELAEGVVYAALLSAVAQGHKEGFATCCANRESDWRRSHGSEEVDEFEPGKICLNIRGELGYVEKLGTRKNYTCTSFLAQSEGSLQLRIFEKLAKNSLGRFSFCGSSVWPQMSWGLMS